MFYRFIKQSGLVVWILTYTIAASLVSLIFLFGLLVGIQTYKNPPKAGTATKAMMYCLNEPHAFVVDNVIVLCKLEERENDGSL